MIFSEKNICFHLKLVVQKTDIVKIVMYGNLINTKVLHVKYLHAHFDP